MNAILNTSRKSVALSFSFLFFPDQHKLCSHHIIGAAFFFSGVLIKITSTYKPQSDKTVVSSHSMHDENDGRTFQGSNVDVNARRRHSSAEADRFGSFKV